VSIVRPPCREEPRHGDFWWWGPPTASRRRASQPDGAGIGVFDKDGAPVVDKQPWRLGTTPHSPKRPRAARHTSWPCPPRQHGFEHCGQHHPFLQDGRLFAHNGVVQGTDQLDAHLREPGPDAPARWCTVTRTAGSGASSRGLPERPANEGDVGGPAGRAQLVSEHLGVYSLNLVLTTAPRAVGPFATRRPLALRARTRRRGHGWGGPGRDRQPGSGHALSTPRAPEIGRRGDARQWTASRDGGSSSPASWCTLCGPLGHLRAGLPRGAGHLLTISDLDPLPPHPSTRRSPAA